MLARHIAIHSTAAGGTTTIRRAVMSIAAGADRGSWAVARADGTVEYTQMRTLVREKEAEVDGARPPLPAVAHLPAADAEGEEESLARVVLAAIRAHVLPALVVDAQILALRRRGIGAVLLLDGVDRRDLDAEREEVEEEIRHQVARRNDHGSGDDDGGRDARPGSRCGLCAGGRRRWILVGRRAQGRKSDGARGELSGDESFHR